MSMTGLDAFDRTVHRTNVWLNDLMGELAWHALSDRLAVRLRHVRIDQVKHVMPAELEELS